MKDSKLTIEYVQEHAIVLDDLFLDFPLDIRSTHLFKMLRVHGLLRCGCGCCCHAHHVPHVAGAAAPTPAPSPAPAPSTQVTLDGTAYALTVVGSAHGTSARVDFEWSATGAGNVRVDIEVRTVQQHNGYDWTPVSNLRDQPPSGRGIWWGFGLSGPGLLPGFNYEARAVARENGAVTAYSNIVTF